MKWIGDNILALLALVVALTNAAYTLVTGYRGRGRIILTAHPGAIGLASGGVRDRAMIKLRAVSKDVGVENVELTCDDPNVDEWGSNYVRPHTVPAEVAADSAALWEFFSPARVVAAHSVSTWMFEWITSKPELEGTTDAVRAVVTLTNGKVLRSDKLTMRRALIPFTEGLS